MFRKILYVLTAAFLMLGTMMPATTAYALSGNATQKRLLGKVSGVNTVAKTITVTSRTGKLVTVRANRRTSITRNGVPTNVKHLLVGDKFSGSYDPATMVASAVEDQETPESHAEVYGILAAVDTIAGTVTITPSNGAANVTLFVDGSTDLQRNDVTVTLADFVVGDIVEAHYDPATMIASEIHTSVDDEDEDGQIDMYGLVSAVDTVAGTLTVTPIDGGAAVTVSVDGSTEITKDDAPATLANFVVGDSVEVEYDPITMIATQIDGE
jgi:hypothetical protein